MKYILTYKIEGESERVKVFLDREKFNNELHRIVTYTKWIKFSVKKEIE